MTPREWNAASYDRVGSPMTDMAIDVLDSVELNGDETVLDAGCGTGRVTEEIVRRVPSGTVIAADASADMCAKARARLKGAAEVIETNLLDLDLPEQVDVAFSTATFHWISDHEALFARLRRAVKRGG